MNVTLNGVILAIFIGIASFVLLNISDGTNITVNSFVPAATYKVCASDATNTDGCDYTANGTNDHVTINAAFTACPASGCTVYLSEGTFTVGETATCGGNSNGQICPNDNQSLIGAGPRATILTFPADTSPGSDRYMVKIGQGSGSVDNVVLRDFGCIAQDAQDHCLDFRGASNVLAESLHFSHSGAEASGDEGIQFWSTATLTTTNITLRNVYVDGFGAANIEISGQNIAGALTTDIVVDAVTSVNAGGAGLYIRDTGADSTVQRIRVLNSHFDGNTNAGLNVEGQHNYISGNSATNNTSIGYDVVSTYTTFFGNIASGNGSDGFLVETTASMNLFSNNLTYLNDGNGFDVKGDDNILRGNIVLDNGVSTGGNGGAGVFLDTSALDNVLTDNLSIDTADTQTYGFREAAGGVTGTRYIRNKAEGNETSDFSVTSTADLAGSRDNVGFVLENSGTATIANATTAITVTHGLAVTPAAGDCWFLGDENPTNTPGAHWIDTYTSTQFNANVENDPGASNYDVVWFCEVR